MSRNNSMPTKPIVGVPVDGVALGEPFHDRSSCQDGGDQYLKSLGLPSGLANEFKRTLASFPARTWILDNSGSMATTDGHRIVSTLGGKSAEISSTRWEELGDSIHWHGSLAAQLNAPTEFRLLNHPGQGVPQVVRCGFGGNAHEEIETLKRLVATSPTGRTPLCHQIREVASSISRNADALRAKGQRHVVIIASDGVATDGDVAEAMRPLQNLPVWVVVRLCTDEDAVVNYWNKIDEELELDLDVLDDLCGEAKEVCALSPWLTYGMPLHRLREWGCMHKVFDLLDEKRLSAAEMRELLVMLLDEQDLPHPEIDFVGFEKATVQALAKLPTVYDPIRKRRLPWVDMGRLRSRYDPQFCCVIA